MINNTFDIENFSSASRGSGASGYNVSTKGDKSVGGSTRSSGVSHASFNSTKPVDNSHMSAHYKNNDTVYDNHFKGFDRKSLGYHYGTGVNKNRFNIYNWTNRHNYGGGWWRGYPYWWYWLSYYPGYYYYDDSYYNYYDSATGTIVYSDVLPYDYTYTALPKEYLVKMPQQHGDNSVAPIIMPNIELASQKEEMLAESTNTSTFNMYWYFVIFIVIILYILLFSKLYNK
jgi:hypothetical protein